MFKRVATQKGEMHMLPGEFLPITYKVNDHTQDHTI